MLMVLSVVVASRVPLMVADIMLIYITWTKLSSRDLLKNGIRQSTRPTLAYVCVRDGECVVIANVEQVIHSRIMSPAQGPYTSCTFRLYTGLWTRPEIMAESYSS